MPSKPLTSVLYKMRFSSLGLRPRLLLFMVVVTIPIILLVVYNIDQRRQHQIELVQNQALSVAQLAASTQHQRIESARHLLVALAQTQNIRMQNMSVCNAYLGQLLPKYAHYNNIVALTTSGDVFCSASPTLPNNISQTSTLLNNLLVTETFTASDIFINQQTGHPTIIYAEPIVDINNEISGAIMVYENLNWMDHWFNTVEIPFNAHLTILNDQGVVVLHYPSQRQILGQPFIDESMFGTMQLMDEGILDSVGHHNEPSIHGFTQINNLPSATYLSVSIEKSIALKKVDANSLQNIVVIMAISGIFFAFIWYGGTRIIIAPINQLNHTVQQLIAGEDNPHTNVTYSVNELVQLAHAIDRLSNTLHEREKDVQKATHSYERQVNEYEVIKALLKQALLDYEAEIEQRKRAQQADNLKLRFLGMVAHELQTPLTSIKGFATTLLADDVEWDEANQRRFLQIIDEETDNVVELVTQLLDLSQIESGMMRIHPSKTGLCETAQKAEPHLKALADKHQLQMLLLENEFLPIYVDAKRITQVLVNLVSNAAKYSEPNTKIIIEAKQEPNYVQINVIDEGIGIKPEDIDRVFKPFIRSEKWLEKRNGSGLGLAICKGIIEAHGGKIWATSHGDHKGTTISFTLPLAKSINAIPEHMTMDESN